MAYLGRLRESDHKIPSFRPIMSNNGTILRLYENFRSKKILYRGDIAFSVIISKRNECYITTRNRKSVETLIIRENFRPEKQERLNGISLNNIHDS